MIRLLGLGLVVSFGALAPAVGHAAWQTRDAAGLETHVYVPGSVSEVGNGRALLLALHGCNQTAEQLRDYGNFELAAEDLGVVIAIPNVPGGGVYQGCWNYYGPIHSRDGGHEGPAIASTRALRDDPALLVDPAQIYVAGFSAGGGEALVLGCVAPDLFAGVAAGAAPSVGTTGDEIQTVGTTAEDAATLCTSLALEYADQFGTQLAVTFTDNADLFVPPEYAEINADAYELLFGDGGLVHTPADLGALEGVGVVGQGTVYADADGPRVMWLHTSSGTGHNWPAGSGQINPPLAFVSGAGVNLSYVATRFFADNARRAGTDWTPPPDDPLPSDDGGSDTGDADTGDDGESTGAPPADSDTTASHDDTATSTGAGQDEAEYIEPSGCQCTPGHGRPTPALGWALPWLLLVSLRAARRRTTAPRRGPLLA